MPTINLHVKYASELEKRFSANSFVKGNTDNNIDFTGARTVKLSTLQTTPVNEYKRHGSSRYGELEEIGETVQEMTMRRDVSFTGTVDKGNASDQMIKNKAAAWLNDEIKTEVVPEADKYALRQYIRFAHVATISAAPTKANIIEQIADAAAYMDDHLVPESDRVLYLTSEMCKIVCLSPEFLGVDKLAEGTLTKGMVGEVLGLRVVRVPRTYLPDNCFFLATHKTSVLFPEKINESKVHTDPVGISGAVVEGRHYYDAFVKEAKKHGVYALVKASEQLATPTLACATPGTTPVSITCTGASEICYTLDGTDPRFSDSKVQAASIPTTAWESGKDVTVRAVAFANNKFTSDIAEHTFTR